MTDMMALTTSLAQAGGQAPGGVMGFLIQFAPIILIFLVFWFLFLRPQRQEQQRLEEFRKNLTVGAEVVTAGGVFGKVAEVDGQVVVLEVAKGTKVRILRRQIQGTQKEMLAQPDAPGGASGKD